MGSKQHKILMAGRYFRTMLEFHLPCRLHYPRTPFYDSIATTLLKSIFQLNSPAQGATSFTMETVTVPAMQIIADYDDDINAINLQLQEIQSYSSSEKQKYPEGRAPDREMAIHHFETELGKLLIVLGDQRFATSIQRAIDHDAMAIAEFTAGEDQACRDRAMAQRISNGVTNGEDLESLSGNEEVKENNWTLEGAPYTIPIIEPGGGDAAGPSVSRIQQRHTDIGPFPSSMVDCVVCGDAFHLPELIRSPCGHLYCPDCLNSLFVRATTDETLFPPRCCSQIISLSLVEAKLSPGALSAFNSAAIEFTTTNRTYCARKDCGKFIPPHEIRSGRAVCRNCNAETCAYCKGVLHVGDCPEDEALQIVLVLAQGERWRRCFGCNTMVELNTGCNHITYVLLL